MLVTAVVVMLWCVTSSISAQQVHMYGSVFKSASEINLLSNVTSYTVGCKLETTRSGVDSRFLGLYLNSAKVESQIVNETTIQLEVDLPLNDESSVCGVKTYTCSLNQTTVVHSATVYVGKPPRPIDPADFRCISENREYLVCDFPQNDYCSLNTLYKLALVRHHISSDCALEKVDPSERIKFDSRSESCPYSAGYRSFTFELESHNAIGETVAEYHFSHYDLVRPAAPSSLEVANITTSSLDFAWSLSKRLINLDRQLELQFLLVSEYGVEKNAYSIISFNANDTRLYRSFADLTPYTQYVLSIQARVVPLKPRASENDYWSDWSHITFKTKACRPYQAPTTLPGAYSLLEITGSYVTVDVFWLKIPQHLQNGPMFRYNVSAIAKSGQRYFPSTMGNETATFQKLKIDYYRVEISCQNEEGPTDGNSLIEIFPPAENLKPKLKRTLVQDGYQLSWYPVPEEYNVLNYTIVYCNFTATGTCRDGLQFATVSALETVFSVPAKRVLNFAVAAVYRNYTSDLSWQKCVVSGDTGIGQPKFSITDTTIDSFVIRINDSCTERSLVQRYEISVWTNVTASLVRNVSFDPYLSVIAVDGLSSGTPYKVMVTAFHASEAPQHKVDVIRTARNTALLQSILYSLGALIIFIAMFTRATRKLKKMMNIKVDIPLGLIGIDESKDTDNHPDHQEKFNSNEIVISAEDSIKISGRNDEAQSTPLPIPRNLNESSNSPNLSPLSTTASNNLNWLRKNVHTATDNLYILPQEMAMAPMAMEKPKENHFSAISTTSSGYVDLNHIVNDRNSRTVM
ncbi:cytokine receptor-like [Sabethes cyaneus]|uniref:cytokine receptor-like n=1 Tax=Sabethes cyaneus TaxID=53552 RepID=UPI00237DCE62|nr:cytokine receptor-like [Sabethes cyaneus]